MSVNSRAQYVIRVWTELRPGEKREIEFAELQSPGCGAFGVILGRENCPDIVYAQIRSGKQVVYIAVGRNELADMPLGTWVRLCSALEAAGKRRNELCDVPQAVKR